MTQAERAAAFAGDAGRSAWHDEALWFVRAKRDRAAAEVPDWAALRNEAAAIKHHALSCLPELWERFESAAQAKGAQLHWAPDAAAHNEIVARLLLDRGARCVVKSKSMLTEECGLNPYLEARGIEVVDTDLGERIVQLRGEPPSHIVLPAIHLRRGDVGALFAEHLGGEPGCDDPARLTELARAHLRERFFAADAGITGVNFAVAETGGLVVCTNEGNADLGTALPKLHIACVGVEKIIPELADLPVFLRLLARSATGQAITAYTSHFHGPAAPEAELHVVVVDNGRSALLAQENIWEALACIRCGACMNTCPVYRRSGGHSYDACVPGPIGSVLEAARAPGRRADLPRACSLCFSCAAVCPVGIPLPDQLLRLRERAWLQPGFRQRAARAGFWLVGTFLAHPWLYRAAGALARAVGRRLPERWLRRLGDAWTRERALPPLPRRSFRGRHAQARSGGEEREC